MDIVNKIDKIRLEKGWSVNRLASESMLTQSTVANIFNSNAEPKISTLKAICEAFNMTLSELFYEGTETEISPKILEMIVAYNKLTEKEKNIIYELITEMSKTKTAKNT